MTKQPDWWSLWKSAAMARCRSVFMPCLLSIGSTTPIREPPQLERRAPLRQIEQISSLSPVREPRRRRPVLRREVLVLVVVHRLVLDAIERLTLEREGEIAARERRAPADDGQLARHG